MDFLHKVPVMQNMFLCHEIILGWVETDILKFYFLLCTSYFKSIISKHILWCMLMSSDFEIASQLKATKHLWWQVDCFMPKGPYPPFLHMADRALLAGYPRSQDWLRWWLGAVRLESLTYGNLDTDLCHNLVGISQNKLLQYFNLLCSCAFACGAYQS